MQQQNNNTYEATALFAAGLFCQILVITSYIMPRHEAIVDSELSGGQGFGYGLLIFLGFITSLIFMAIGWLKFNYTNYETDSKFRPLTIMLGVTLSLTIAIEAATTILNRT